MRLSVTGGFALAVAAMAAIVAASNVLVQYPVQARLGAVNLADLLTWGAFTYPFSFLVTDLTNRSLGPAVARRVVLTGFAIAVVLSIWLATPRIAIASGTAFLVAQLLDVAIFHRLRTGAWWRAPVVSTTVGSIVDTALFFSLAFAATFSMLGENPPFFTAPTPLLGVFSGLTPPLWVSLALGDLVVKLLLAGLALVPYRLVLGLLRPWRPAAL